MRNLEGGGVKNCFESFFPFGGTGAGVRTEARLVSFWGGATASKPRNVVAKALEKIPGRKYSDDWLLTNARARTTGASSGNAVRLTPAKNSSISRLARFLLTDDDAIAQPTKFLSIELIVYHELSASSCSTTS